MLTVRELLFESGLPLKLVSGQSGIGRAIEGIHLSDLPDPVPWMTRGMVLLTAGPGFATDPGEGIRLLDRLSEIDAAALGVSVGHHMESVSAAVVEHADSLHIPVFEIAPGVPMRTVISYVNDSLASTDLHRLRRTVAMHHRLLELVAGERGVEELLSSVASLLEMPMLLFDGSGGVVAGAGAPEPERLAERAWAAYAKAGESVGPAGMIQDGRARIYFREVVLFGRLERVLVARAPQVPPSEFVEAALTFLQRLVTLDLLRERDALTAERRARARLLNDFIYGLAPADSLDEQLQRQGIDLQRPWRFGICEIAQYDGRAQKSSSRAEGTHGPVEAVMEAAESFFLGHRIHFLAAAGHASVLLLFSPDDSGTTATRGCLEQLREAALAAAGGSLAIGCSAALSGPDLGTRSLRQSQEALTVAQQRGFGPVVLFDELGGLVRLLAQLGDETLRAVLEETVTPLMDWDAARQTELIHTLEVLFENRLGMQDTAVALGVHRNTLQKRLRRIERLLSVDLDQLDDLLQLYLGLRASELLDTSRIGSDTSP